MYCIQNFEETNLAVPIAENLILLWMSSRMCLQSLCQAMLKASLQLHMDFAKAPSIPCKQIQALKL